MGMPIDPVWRARLARRLDEQPHRPRLPLTLADDGSAIGSIEPVLAERLAAAGMPLQATSAGWAVAPLADAGERDAALARIATWLHSNGVVNGWRDELLAVVDVQGATRGAIERAAVRALGIATRAVHLIVRAPRGRVWVQQRAFDKATDPGLWDTTMGGLSAAGESSAQTLERETWEEAGLRLAQLSAVESVGGFTVRRPVCDGYLVEQIEVVEASAAEGVLPVNRDGEVERFECIDRATLVERLHADAFTLEAAMMLTQWVERDALRADVPLHGGAARG